MYNPSEQYKYLYRTHRWRKLSLQCRQQNPRCHFCGKPSQVCDHKRAHKGNRELFYNPDNLMALCKRCHDSAKFRMELGQIPGKDFVVNNESDDDGLPLSPNHPWNK